MALAFEAKDLSLFKHFRIPIEQIERNQVRRVSDCEARELLGINGEFLGRDLSGLYFDYLDEKGRHIGARLRRDNPDPGSKNKYLMERNSRHLYVTREGFEQLGNPEAYVAFVESEKSAHACQAWAARVDRKIVFIATGGCWGWRERTGKELNEDGTTSPTSEPVRELIMASMRTAFILFDGNVLNNPEVKRARTRFATCLRNDFGAKQVCKLLLPEGDWNGPDDFLAKNTDEALTAIFQKPQLDTVVIRAGQHPEAVDQCEEIMLEHAERLGLYQRAGELVRIIRLPKAMESGGLRRPEGSLMLDPLNVASLGEIWERYVDFQKPHDKKKGQTVPANCPSRMVNAYLNRRGEWKLDLLVGTISAPIVRLDGSVFNQPGYDSATGLYLAETLDVHVPENPTIEDAQAALATLKAPFAEFPFCSEADRAVHLCAIVTALERRLLVAAPLFGYSAPVFRTGKSKLAESDAIIATGRAAPATAVSPDSEEMRKALFAAVREGHPVINLDNVEHALKSSDLSKILTQAAFKDRVLGESKMLEVPTNMMWTATGNNLTFRGDLTSRVLLCRIDAGVERPEARRFANPDLEGYLVAHRAVLVSSGLTILRAYQLSGEKPKLTPWGGFNQWSDFIREAMVWAGCADPCDTREGVIEDDPDKEIAAELLRELVTRFDDTTFTAKQLVDRALVAPDLHAALVAVSGGKNVDPNVLGRWLRKWKNRIVDGLRLTGTQDRKGVMQWKVCQ
jgi:putative DNA primase/helicase